MFKTFLIQNNKWLLLLLDTNSHVEVGGLLLREVKLLL